MKTVNTHQAPVNVEVALPSLNFVNFARVIPFRFLHRGEVVLREVSLSVESSALNEDSSLCRNWLEVGGDWMDRLPVEPVKTGFRPLDIRVSFLRGSMLRETWLYKHDWRVKAVPQSVQELKLELKSEKLEIDEKAIMGGIVADGNVKIGHQSNVHFDGNINQTIDSILDKQDENPQYVPLLLKLENRELISFRNQVGMELVAVHEGEFYRGSLDWEEGKPPFDPSEHRSQVRISRSFWMGQYEVTQRQWQQVMGQGTGYKQEEFENPDFPAHGMSWSEARDFCDALTAYERERGGLPEGYIYRLPTETEWEYACRAGCETHRYEQLELCANTSEGKKGMLAVGQLRPNDWGFHDMLGNVFEWTLDVFGEYSVRDDYLNPFRGGAGDAKRVIRGGCFQTDGSYARAAARVAVPPGQQSGRIGLRVVLAVEGWPDGIVNSE